MNLWPWRATKKGETTSPDNVLNARRSDVTAPPVGLNVTPGFDGWSVPLPFLLFWTAMWGIEFHRWGSALCVMLVIAAPQVIAVRWTFSLKWRRRSFWGMGILVLMMGTYAWLNKVPMGTVWFTISWFPVMLLPLLASDRWGALPTWNEALPPLAKAWPWSNRPTPRPAISRERWSQWSFQFAHRYTLPVVLYPRALFAGALWITVLTGALDYVGVIVLIATGMWGLKGVRGGGHRSPKEWAAFIVVLALLGAGGFGAMHALQSVIEDMSMRWMSNHRNNNDWFDPTHTETRIGQTGNLDTGESLRFRLEWDQPPNGHLPVAVFDVVGSNGVQWDASRRLSTSVQIKTIAGARTLPGAQSIPETTLESAPPAVRKEIAFIESLHAKDAAKIREMGPPKVGPVTMPNVPLHVFTPMAKPLQAVLRGTFARTARDRIPLPLPANSQALYGQSDSNVAENAAGTVTMTGTSGEVLLRVQYSSDPYVNLQVPGPEDTRVPVGVAPVLDTALSEAGLRSSDTPDQAAQQIGTWFKTHYHYTLNLGDRRSGGRSLSAFLTTDREGHCEYFAAATTLMLRKMGIPARYVTGVLVTERHPEEDPSMYWVRDRNFHAWVVYWNGAGWKTLDSTPPDIGEAWDQDRPWYLGILNRWEHWQYVLANFDINTWEAQWALPAAGVVVLFLAAIAWFQRHRFQTFGQGFFRKRRGAVPVQDPWPASEHRFEETLAQVLAASPRRGEEPWGVWAARVGDPALQAAVREHYEARYGRSDGVDPL